MADEAYKEALAQLLTLFPDRLSISVCETAKVLMCSKTMLYEMARDPGCDFPFLRIGGKLTITLPALARWITDKEALRAKARRR